MSVTGIIGSTGLAFGQAVHIIEQDYSVDLHLLRKNEVPKEQQRLREAIHHILQLLIISLEHLDSDSENYKLIESDILLLDDQALLNQMLNCIEGKRYSASLAVQRTFETHAYEIECIEDPMIASRGQDIRHLSARIIASINGTLSWSLEHLDQDTIILAHDITPAEFALLPKKYIRGIVLETGGITSHTAILARAAGIPALLDCQYQHLNIQNGQPIALDAIDGVLHHLPDNELVKALSDKQLKDKSKINALLSIKNQTTQTVDGHPVSLWVNVTGLNDVIRSTEIGSLGVGLFRTEFMLMHATEYPCEQKQYQTFCDALHSLNGMPLTIRTLDLGADKPLPFERKVQEDNPALGIRGCRYSLAHPQYFKPQLKAAMRAANHGHVRLMFPMINQIEEIEEIKAVIEECKQELVNNDIGYGDFEFGIMIETPAAVFNLTSMLPELDFISIGTNDLTQYSMAADRSNTKLARVFPSLSPAILKTIDLIVIQAKQFDVSVSLCGELASVPKVVPLLVGLGLSELSVDLNKFLEIKSIICSGDYNQFQELAEKALKQTKIQPLQQLIYTRI
ncbi:phosphoenolpyruvate--protein phosphotransferase [Parashewanella curva]|uniref:Phosphoenolpyruvate-protein phosphotransferase n=1 Tax=Parashewanella curva TaxID=2338552 RepID=A0A3L8PVA7_9GAMM|nr:phosphoenolpyruvate--protein phosphotransferase [Parashewanella curva]RLV59266.1 phosphoenolpyruvate--protein phosphotransferase [Parashewanella curva]